MRSRKRSLRNLSPCLVLMAFLMVFGNRENTRKKMKLIFALCVLVVVAVILMSWLFPMAMEYFIGRFQVEDITTGRADLMRMYHEYITDHFNVMFFGVGLNDFSNRIVDVYSAAWNVPHNSIQEIILVWGIPGLLMMGLLLLVVLLKSKTHNRRLCLLNFIPLIIILVKSLAGQLLTSGYTLLALSFAYLSLCQIFSSEANNSQTDYTSVEPNTDL